MSSKGGSLVLGLVLAAAAFAAVPAAGLVPPTCPQQDGVDLDVAGIVTRIQMCFIQFQPPDREVANEGVLVLEHQDGTLEHNPASNEPVVGDCFEFRRDVGGSSMHPDPFMTHDDRWALRFRYDGAGPVQVSPDGGETWRDCPGAAAVTTATEAEVPYQCTLHPDLMQGTITVRTTLLP